MRRFFESPCATRAGAAKGKVSHAPRFGPRIFRTRARKTLARALTQLDTHGAVAACGNAAGNDLPTTVLPFILRGVNLLGIDSNYCPPARRQRAWDRLAREMPMDKLDAMTTTVPLAGTMGEGEKILKGQVRGRCVIDVNA